MVEHPADWTRTASLVRRCLNNSTSRTSTLHEVASRIESVQSDFFERDSERSPLAAVSALLPPCLPLRRADAARVPRSLVVEHGELETDGAVRAGAAVRIEQSGDRRHPGDESLER